MNRNESIAVIADPSVKQTKAVYLTYKYAKGLHPAIGYPFLTRLYTIYLEDPERYETERDPWDVALCEHPGLKKETQHIQHAGHIFRQMVINLSGCSDREIAEGFRTVAGISGSGFIISFLFLHLLDNAGGNKILIINPTLEILDTISTRANNAIYTFVLKKEYIPLYKRLFPEFNFYSLLSEINEKYDITVFLYQAERQDPPAFPNTDIAKILSLRSATVYLIVPETRWFHNVKTKWQYLLETYHVCLDSLIPIPTDYSKTKEKKDSTKTKRLLMILSSAHKEHVEVQMLQYKGSNSIIQKKPTALFSASHLLNSDKTLKNLYDEYLNSSKPRINDPGWSYEYAPGILLHANMPNSILRVRFQISRGINTDPHQKTVHTLDEALTFLEQFPFIPDVYEKMVPLVKKQICKEPACAMKTLWFGLSEEFGKAHRDVNNALKTLFSKERSVIYEMTQAETNSSVRKEFILDTVRRFNLESSLSTLRPARATSLDYQNALKLLFPNKDWQDLPVKFYEQIKTLLSFAFVRGIDVRIEPINELLSIVSTRQTKRQKEASSQLMKRTFSSNQREKLNYMIFKKGE